MFVLRLRWVVTWIVKATSPTSVCAAKIWHTPFGGKWWVETVWNQWCFGGSNRILQIWCGFPKPQFLTGFTFTDSCWGFIRQCSVGLSQQCFVLKGTGHDWTLSKSIFVRAVWDLAGWHNARFLQMMSSRKCFLAGGMRMMGCGCIKREKDVSIIATDVWFSIESHLNFTWVHPCLPQVADMHLREAQPSSNDWELSLVQGWRSLVGKLFWFKHVFAIFVKIKLHVAWKEHNSILISSEPFWIKKSWG